MLLVRFLIQQQNIAIFATVWVNVISKKFLKSLKGKDIFVFETTVHNGDFTSMLSTKLHEQGIEIGSLFREAIQDLPECGSNNEVLNYHRLDSSSILHKVTE